MSLADASFKTDYHSFNSSMTQTLNQPCITFVCDEVSLILTDDCIESYNQLDEYIRMTLDTMIITVRPRVMHSQSPRCLNGKLSVIEDFCLTVSGIQIDNQMFSKGCYDFPIFLKGQTQKSGVKETELKLPLFNQDYIMDAVKEKSLFKLALTLDRNTNTNTVTSVNLRLNPINVFVEDIFIHKMSDILRSLISDDEDDDEVFLFIKEIVMTSSNLANPFWLERLTIAPLHILVSVHASIKAYVGLDQSPLSFGSYHHENFLVTNFALGM